MAPEKRTPSGRFVKGLSGNPGGRPAGLRAAVHARCGAEAQRLVEGLALIAFGPPRARHAFFGETVRVTAKDRAAAITDLLDRGWGKATQPVTHSGDDDRPPVVHTIVYADVQP